MVCENDKSYRLEILIVYAWNKFLYAHGINFFSTGIKFLNFFLSICVFQILREIPHFESARQKKKPKTKTKTKTKQKKTQKKQNKTKQDKTTTTKKKKTTQKEKKQTKQKQKQKQKQNRAICMKI